MSFPYKVALITGATEGIGRATAFALGRAGYRVGVCARTEAKVRRLVDELQSVGIEAAGAPTEEIPRAPFASCGIASVATLPRND
ncbi:MAG TPA: SDR family NAD(P)-dependent oxidoreductase [Gemmatimonadales bacterium]|nr:SDR family NAD(P)-dependent oxidoreductase [Gemmatimonadales bacterium]